MIRQWTFPCLPDPSTFTFAELSEEEFELQFEADLPPLIKLPPLKKHIVFADTLEEAEQIARQQHESECESR